MYAIDPDSTMESFYLSTANALRTGASDLDARVDVGKYEFIVLDMMAGPMAGVGGVIVQTFTTETGGTASNVEAIVCGDSDDGKSWLRSYRVRDLPSRWLNIQIVAGTNIAMGIRLIGLQSHDADSVIGTGNEFNKTAQVESGLS